MASNTKTSRQPSPDALIRLHEYVSDELTRYRDLEWKIPSLVITFLFALTTAIGTDSIRSLLTSSLPLKVGLTLVVISLLTMVFSFINFTQSGLKRMRDLLAIIENELELAHLIKKAFTPSAQAGKKERVRKKIALAWTIQVVTLCVTIVSIGFIWLK